MFFGCRMRGVVPNQFARECDMKTAIKKRVQKQVEVVTMKGCYNRDEFEENVPVRIKNMQTGKWDILGVMSRAKSKVSAYGSRRAYTVLADNRTLYH